MHDKQVSQYFLLICLAASIAVAYFIIQPFLTPLILASVFAFLSQPVYRKLLRLTNKRAGLSSLIVTLSTIILVVLPIIFIGTLILKESSQLYQTLAGNDQGGLIRLAGTTIDRIRTTLHIPATFELDLGQYAQQGLKTLAQNIGAIFSSFAKIFIDIFIFIMAFYYFLIDGSKLKKFFITLSPLDDKDDELIVSRLKSAISATVKGKLTIGLIQGILTCIGFLFFGVPNAVLWGSLTAIAALIPGIGTALIVVPGVMYLFIIGKTLSAAGLAFWGLIIVGLVDNILGPRIIGQDLQLHPLAVFLSVLGGLAFFGPLGFLLGPLAMSICLALIDIYFSLKTRENKTT